MDWNSQNLYPSKNILLLYNFFIRKNKPEYQEYDNISSESPLYLSCFQTGPRLSPNLIFVDLIWVIETTLGLPLLSSSSFPPSLPLSCPPHPSLKTLEYKEERERVYRVLSVWRSGLVNEVGHPREQLAWTWQVVYESVDGGGSSMDGGKGAGGNSSGWRKSCFLE